MAEFTFLKLQLDNASFPANAPLVNKTESGEETEWESEADEDEDAVSLLPLLIGLVGLAIAAYVVKKLLSDSEDIEVDVDVAE
jgi:hypothetical protein